MPFFGIIWATSWLSFFVSSNQGFSKVPDYLVSTFPLQVFSRVNSPIELPKPIFSTSLTSVVWSSPPSIITPPNLDWSMNVGLSSSQSATAFTSPAVPVGAVENTFCHTELELGKDTIQVATASNLWKETSSSNQPKATLYQQIWQVVQNLLPWYQRPEAGEESLALSVKVVSTHCHIVGQQPSEKGRVKPGFWQYSQGIKKKLWDQILQKKNYFKYG